MSAEQSNLFSANPDTTAPGTAPDDAPYPKRPVTLADTGLSEQLLLQLLIKHILVEHVVSVRLLADKMALAGGIIQALLDQAKAINWLENRQSAANGQMRYALNALGMAQAEQAQTFSGYLGPAPVPLAQYQSLCLSQTSRNTLVDKARMEKVFQGISGSSTMFSKKGRGVYQRACSLTAFN